MREGIYTAESVTKGHPDKFCDLLSDWVLEECLTHDKDSRVACEALATKGLITFAGEITSRAKPDYRDIARKAAEAVGYNISGIGIAVQMHAQSPDIADAVDKDVDFGGGDGLDSFGAGDQGIMVGYATDETLSYMPLEYELAVNLTNRLEKAFDEGTVAGLKSDGKSQVTIELKQNRLPKLLAVVVSAQHAEDADIGYFRRDIRKKIIDDALIGYKLDTSETEIYINPSGRFAVGGIDADTGLTGRKIVCDAYGPRVPVGGGAFSGKDASKVDRSGAYMARYIAKNIVSSWLAKECKVTISYAIGKSRAVSVDIDTFGTGIYKDGTIRDAVLKALDLRPKAIIKQFNLTDPVFTKTSSGGHFGRSGLPWEKTDKWDALHTALKGACYGD